MFWVVPVCVHVCMHLCACVCVRVRTRGVLAGVWAQVLSPAGSGGGLVNTHQSDTERLNLRALRASSLPCPGRALGPHSTPGAGLSSGRSCAPRTGVRAGGGGSNGLSHVDLALSPSCLLRSFPFSPIFFLKQ